jgi:hypothetical protein
MFQDHPQLRATGQMLESIADDSKAIYHSVQIERDGFANVIRWRNKTDCETTRLLCSVKIFADGSMERSSREITGIF